MWDELFNVVYHGKVGGLDVAMRMPIEIRRHWLEKTAKEKEPRKEVVDPKERVFMSKSPWDGEKR